MLNDNSLGERLNAVKQGKPVPAPPMQPRVPHPQQNQTMSFWAFMLGKTFHVVDVFAASFLYGFAIKTIFSLDWTIIGALAVGFMINHAITLWPRLIRTAFKK